MRDYGKVHSTFWTSDSTRSLSDDGKTLALYLLTGPHTNIIGAFRLPDGYAASDLKWAVDRVARGFDELFQSKFATRDGASEWIVIHKYLKWNPIENPNQAKAAFSLFDQILGSCSTKPVVARALSGYAAKFITGPFKTLLEPFLNPSETLSEPLAQPFRNQEQEQEQKQEQENSPPPPSGGGERAPARRDESFDRVVEAYNRHLPNLSPYGIHRDRDFRNFKLNLAIDPVRGSPEFWLEKIFKPVGRNSFLMGREPPKKGRKGIWKADLSWLFDPDNVAKILNGGYPPDDGYSEKTEIKNYGTTGDF